jgi:hypothetical protein
VFEKYRFRSAYAEDFDLGIRLIQDGHRLGFLSSTRVLHSHNRRAFYFLKRGYVDVRFLTDVFPNFVYPEINDKGQLYAEILGLQAGFAAVMSGLFRQSYPLPIATLIDFFRCGIATGDVETAEGPDTDIQQLMQLLCKDLEAEGLPRRTDHHMVWPHIAKHLEAFGQWVSAIYQEADQALANDIASAVGKILAVHFGTHLAYLYMTRAARKRMDKCLEQLDARLTAGV